MKSSRYAETFLWQMTSPIKGRLKALKIARLRKAETVEIPCGRPLYRNKLPRWQIVNLLFPECWAPNWKKLSLKSRVEARWKPLMAPKLYFS